MNISDFVIEASKQIDNKRQRAQFEKELTNHILDRVEYYEEKRLCLGIDYDWSSIYSPQSSEWWGSDGETRREIEVQLLPSDINKIYYGKSIVTNDYYTPKRYVAVIPVVDYEDNQLNLEYAKWFDTIETKILDNDVDKNKYSEFGYRIELTDRIKKYYEYISGTKNNDYSEIMKEIEAMTNE